MRKVMTAAAAIALMAPFGAAAGDEPKSGEKLKTETQAAEVQKDQAAAKMNKDVLHLKADQLSAKDLLGAGIVGSSGERIARVDDIVIDDNGQASSVVFLEGGVFGLGGKKGALEFERVNLAIQEIGEPRVAVSMTEDALDSVAEFEEESAVDHSLASELIGASVRFADGGEEEATITDLILDRNGDVRYVVVRENWSQMWTDERRAFAFSDLTVEQGAGGLVLNADAETFADAPRFEYRDTAELDRHETVYEPRDDMSDDMEDPSDQQ